MKHDPDDFSVWRAIRVALGLAPRPDMTPEGRARRAQLRQAEWWEEDDGFTTQKLT